MPPELIRDCLTLTRIVWPPKEMHVERVEKQRIEEPRIPGDRWHVVRQENRVVAVSRSFPRVIAEGSGRRFSILALASVCTHPDHRHAGLGRSVVAAAWSRLSPDLPVCFFQTGVPAFYEKQGARVVDNLIRNGKEGAKAFWDPYAMIYPASAPWPETPIDLLGPGW